jgi:hypothetical protein
MPLGAIDWIEVSAVATGLLAVATFAFVVVAGLQSMDTVRAAFAAQRAAEASEVTLDLQQEMWDTQSRLATYPALICDFSYDDWQAYLLLQNSTSLPAYDVELHVLSSFGVELHPPDEFAVRYLSPEHQDAMQETEEGFFSIYDHLSYAHVGPHRAVKAAIHSPTPAPFLHVLLQFRDLLGRNYCRLYTCGQSDDPGVTKYLFTLYTIPEDQLLADIPRIEPLGFPDDPPLPEFPALQREFAESFEKRVAPGYLVKPQLEIEERGEWKVA